MFQFWARCFTRWRALFAVHRLPLGTDWQAAAGRLAGASDRPALPRLRQRAVRCPAALPPPSDPALPPRRDRLSASQRRLPHVRLHRRARREYDDVAVINSYVLILIFFDFVKSVDLVDCGDDASVSAGSARDAGKPLDRALPD